MASCNQFIIHNTSAIYHQAFPNDASFALIDENYKLFHTSFEVLNIHQFSLSQ